MPRHEVGVDQELCNQKSATVPHAVEVKLGLGDPPCPFRGLGVRVAAGDPVRQRLDLRREQRVGENWNVQAMSKCVLRLLASSEAPRNNALREIERHRAALGSAVRQAIDEIQDAEFRDVDTGEVGGAPPS